MNNFLHRFFQLFSLRLFLNLLLWLVLAFEIYYSNRPDRNIAETYCYKSVSLLSLLLFTYINNLLLIPRFLAKRRFAIYLSLAVLLVFCYAFLYSLFIEAVIRSHPAIQLHEIILFSVSIKTEWSVSAITEATFGYAFIFGIWLFIFIMAWYMHDHARQRKAMLLAQQQQVETELNFLKAQINPHFLFNTLNNLYALALRKSEKSPDAILKLSSILRYLLYDSNTPTVAFHKEKEIMEAYIDIELLRLDNTGQLDVVITSDEPHQIPPLLWLPILENVFKHGTRTMADENCVAFRFEIKNNQLFIYSKNREKMLAKADSVQGGIGLKNLRKRLELLYPGKHDITVTEENNYYISQVKIDLV